MAGHSKWANIQHRKGRQDAARSKLFSKLSKEITVAAKMGDPDPDKNPRLRLAIKEARANSMPKDNIDRAIRKAQGGDAENYEEIRYEGYGPGGVPIIVEAMTDNRNRTASNIRSTFGKRGGNLGETGSVAFMFDRMGQIVYAAGAGSADSETGGAGVVGGTSGVWSAGRSPWMSLMIAPSAKHSPHCPPMLCVSYVDDGTRLCNRTEPALSQHLSQH